MQAHSPVQLARHSREVEAVSWSEDQRIAITTSDEIYVLSLKGSSGSRDSSLPVSISMVAAPPSRENPSPVTTPVFYDPQNDKLDYSSYLDPMLIPGHTPLGYCESGWSPAGCDVIGGCLLSVLTLGGHLWVLTPPGSQTMKWQVSTDLSCDGACTTFHWLPRIIPAEHGVGGAAVIAMATRRRQISILAMEVPVRRGRVPRLHALWEGETEIGAEEDWPCRLCWSHTPSPEAHLAVGMTSGQLLVLSWCLPALWRVEEGEGETLVQPQRRVLWQQDDRMAVKYIAWQHKSSVMQNPWLVFSKVSTLVAMQLQDTVSYTTIYGVHSRAVSGVTALHGDQFVSCSLDSSVQIFSLNQSHDSHVTPTPVAMETVSSDCTAHGVAVSEHGLYVAVLTSVCGGSSISKSKLSSHLHCCPLLPLPLLNLHSVTFSWDIGEALRMHAVAKQPLPSELHISQPWSWQQMSSSVRLCVEECGGGGDAGESGDMVMMSHVCGVLGECEVGEDRDSSLSLYIMSKWVESSQLATPTQQLVAKMILSMLQSRVGAGMTESCVICNTSVPFTNYQRETCANGHTWERCCITLLLATSSLCGRCRGCGATAHNMMSLTTTSTASWFEQLLYRGRCTYCHGFFEQIT